MRLEEIRGYLQRQPFQPFRLTLTDGTPYEIQHPELAMVGRSTMTIGLPWVGHPEPIYDRTVMISLLHITQLEPLAPAAPPTDGQ